VKGERACDGEDDGEGGERANMGLTSKAIKGTQTHTHINPYDHTHAVAPRNYMLNFSCTLHIPQAAKAPFLSRS